MTPDQRESRVSPDPRDQRAIEDQMDLRDPPDSRDRKERLAYQDLQDRPDPKESGVTPDRREKLDFRVPLGRLDPQGHLKPSPLTSSRPRLHQK